MARNDESKRGSGDENVEVERTWGATREYKAEVAEKLAPKDDKDDDKLVESARAEEVGVNPSTGYPHPGSEGEGVAKNEGESAK